MKPRIWLYLILTVIGTVNLYACDREGPAERAGEEVDEAGRAIRDTAKGERDQE